MKEGTRERKYKSKENRPREEKSERKNCYGIKSCSS